MPWANMKLGISFNEASIKAHAPTESGVYALYKTNVWIYIGESQNIRDRLLQHLAETGTCIKRQGATDFSYELVASAQRVARQDALILELNPPCNKKLG